MTNKIPVASEHDEQKALFQWARLERVKFPELALMFAVPNSAKRNPRTAQYMKDEGLRSGVPDIVLPVPKGIYHGAFIEMKRTKGATVDDRQTAWLEALRHLGYHTSICYGWAQARITIETYLSQK
jgi:VRR-NUC domain